MPLALLALALIAFGMGIAEFVIMGLLPDVATDLGVSIPSAGLLVTAYAVGVAVGAPLLTALLGRLPRKTTLSILTLIFLVGNIVSAVSPGYDVLIAARIITAFSHGAFFGIAAVVAADLVPANKKASAIALVMAGHTVANVIGVPFGTFIGQSYGWRVTFWAVAGIGVLALIGCLAMIPSRAGSEPTSLRAELGVLRRRQVLLALLLAVLANSSLFIVYTYITPLATTVTHYSEGAVSWLLMLFGIGVFVGNLLSGKAADKRLMPTIYTLMAVLIVILVAMVFISHSKIALAITMPLFGAASFGLTAPLQMRVVSKASDAPSLASSMNITAFNIANSSGAAIGGWAIAGGLGYAMLGPLAAVFVVIGLFVAIYSGLLDRHGNKAVVKTTAGSSLEHTGRSEGALQK
ncbi:MFS transporter [Nocardiopsis rhodophaea]|uniref:MFS transporter n=1 Tax=Nocardiopsis rhodophaea TaxID=280238 RepID=A0ABP5DM42_9ACTN